MTYRQRPVFTWSLDWTRSPQGRHDFELREVIVGFGTESQFADQTEVVRSWSGPVCLDGLDAIEAFEAFSAAVAGRLVGFWFPIPEAAFAITAGVSATECDIAGKDYVAAFTETGRGHVWLTQAGQTPQATQVVTVEANGDGTSRVTFQDAVTVDATWQAWGLAYVRLAEDTEQAEFTSEQTQERRVQVVELPLEYAAAETGERPVYLYRLWIGEGQDRVQWRWTSFAWDLPDVEGESYQARRITHGAIQYDTTGIRQGVTLDVDREMADSPFPTAFPPHGCQPLNVSIARADYADLATVEVLFQGVVTAVSVSGRVLKVQCATWWGASQTSVPAFLFGPRCPYRVFDPATCRLNRPDFEQAVTIQTMSERNVTVSGAGLAGAGFNRFAEGWIEVGTGLAREVRLILGSTVAAGNTLTLALNAPLRFNGVGATASVVPGCDGRWSTCDTKFANTPNFGGHRFALKNLAVKAIEVPASSGGKK